MSRATIAIMALLGATMVSGAASASGRFCFSWEAVYTDSGFGEDYLSDGDPDGDHTVTIPAKFARVMVHRKSPAGSVYWFWLDGNGCTSSFSLATGQVYEFELYTKLKRDDRYVYVIPDGEEWGSTTVEKFDYDDYYVGDPDMDQPVPAPEVGSGSDPAKAMPVLTQMLGLGVTLDWPDGKDIWVSAWSGNGCGDGGKMWSDGDDCQVCAGSVAQEQKFRTGHEIGHCLSAFNGGPFGASTMGDEGCFRASGVGNRCDCSVSSGGSHCLHSREFTGMAQSEGMAHFGVARGMNADSTLVSTFVYYKNVMKWNSSHGGTLYWPLPLPIPPYVPYFEDPFAVDLSASDNVQWVDYECDPTGDDFEHYGSEWDWLEFFWNLHTDGGSSVKFGVDQINSIWSGVSNTDIAEECCIVNEDEIPLACTPRDQKYFWTECGEGPYLLYPTQKDVGKLWEADAEFDVDEGVRNQAYSTYHASNPDKYTHFRLTGEDARVNY